MEAYVVQASFDGEDTEAQAVFDTLDGAVAFVLCYVDNQKDVTFDAVTTYRREDEYLGGVEVEAREAVSGQIVRLWIQSV